MLEEVGTGVVEAAVVVDGAIVEAVAVHPARATTSVATARTSLNTFI